MVDTPKTVRVDYKSGWYSKINWVQLIGFLAMIGSFFGLEVTPETQAEILAGIVALTTVVTAILKTWFTSTVTPGSIPPGTLIE